MKPYIYIAGALTLMASVSSCNKVEIPYYEGMDGIFFDQQFIGENNESFGTADTTNLTHKLYTPVIFTQTESTDTILAIKVETTGHLRDYVRPFGVHVVADSTTAIEGEDFKLLDESYAILPGNNSTSVQVLVNLTERMYKEQVQIQLGLDPGEHFVLPFGDKFGDMPKRYMGGTSDPVPESRNYDSSVHNIFANCMLTQPANWPLGRDGVNYVVGAGVAVNHFGDFSVTKYATILKVIEARGWTASTFAAIVYPKTDRFGIINRDVAKYLREQYDKGEYVLEDDGTLMWIDNKTLVTWSPDATPADIVK